MILRLAICLFSLTCCVYSRPPSETNSITEVETTTVPAKVIDYFESRVNEVAGVSCEVCLSAVYGLNYNVIRFKKAAEDMVRLDCEALFHGQGSDIAKCIKIAIEKIEHYYEKMEPVIETRNVCVALKMCAPSALVVPLESSTKSPKVEKKPELLTNRVPIDN